MKVLLNKDTSPIIDKEHLSIFFKNHCHMPSQNTFSTPATQAVVLSSLDPAVVGLTALGSTPVALNLRNEIHVSPVP